MAPIILLRLPAAARLIRARDGRQAIGALLLLQVVRFSGKQVVRFSGTRIIKTPDGMRETIEQALVTYQRVVIGEADPSLLLDDPYDVLQLRHKLELAALELRHTRMLFDFVEGEREKRVGFLEGQVRELSTLLGRSLPMSVPQGPEGRAVGEGASIVAMRDVRIVVGAMGTGAHVVGTNVAETWESVYGGLDAKRLVEELAALRAYLGSHRPGNETNRAIEELAEAEAAIRERDQARVMQHLKKAGRWTIRVATEIGCDVAAAALKGALGLRT